MQVGYRFKRSSGGKPMYIDCCSPDALPAICSGVLAAVQPAEGGEGV
jgi:hypothetical protein